MHALVKSVSFLNLWRDNGKIFAVWVVDALRVTVRNGDVARAPPGDYGHASAYYFVVQELTGQDKKAIPGDDSACQDWHLAAGGKWMQWEMALRARHPVISRLMLGHGAPHGLFNLLLRDGVIVDAAPVAHKPPFEPHVGYLYCQTKLAAGDEAKEAGPSHGEPMADPERFRFNVEDMDLFLKTKAGTYMYSTDNEDGGGAKRARVGDGELQILDVFVPCTYNVHIGDSDVPVRLARPPFDILVVNEECKWNRGLILFLGALYRKIYGTDGGLRPAFYYLFTYMANADFSPHFSSFPHIPLVFSSDFKGLCGWTSAHKGASALITLNNKQINNFLLECFTGHAVPPLPAELRRATGIAWPFGAAEINQKLVTGDSGQAAQITGPHCLHVVKFDLGGAAGHRAAPLFQWDTMEMVAGYSTDGLKATICAWYNYLVYSVMNFCHLYGLSWLAFNKNEFYLVSEASHEVSRQHTQTRSLSCRGSLVHCLATNHKLLLQDQSTGSLLRDFLAQRFSSAFCFDLFSSKCQKTVALQHKSTTFIASDCDQLINRREDAGYWTGVVHLLLHLYCLQLPPEKILHTMMTHLYNRRTDTKLWIWPESTCKVPEKCQPHMPISHANGFILTAGGSARPWLTSWGVPSGLFYPAYVQHLLDICSALGEELDSEVTTGLVEILKDLFCIF